MGRRLEQLRALDQGFAHQAELEMLEIAQAAMDELGRGRGRGAGIVAALGEHDLQPAPGGVARHRRAMNAAADDEEIDALRQMLSDAGAEQVVNVDDADRALILDHEQRGDLGRVDHFQRGACQ